MIEKLNLENILFLDIETVPEQENFTTLDSEMQTLWEAKTQYQRKDEFTPEFGLNSEKSFVFQLDISHSKVTFAILE